MVSKILKLVPVPVLNVAPVTSIRNATTLSAGESCRNEKSDVLLTPGVVVVAGARGRLEETPQPLSKTLKHKIATDPAQ